MMDRINVLKALVELIRQLLIAVAIGGLLVAVIVVLVKYPDKIADYFSKREITEVNLGVLKLTIKRSQEAVSDSNQIIATLIERLRNDPATDKSRILAELEKVQRQGQEAATQVQKAQSEVGPSTSKPESVETGTQKWGVIFGSYPSEANTNPELAKAKQLGSGDAKLYLNKGRYRGVLVFSSEVAAREALDRIEGTFRSAYVRNLNDWCGPNASETANLVTC
jgi:hypothetical protein